MAKRRGSAAKRREHYSARRIWASGAQGCARFKFTRFDCAPRRRAMLKGRDHPAIHAAPTAVRQYRMDRWVKPGGDEGVLPDQFLLLSTMARCLIP